MRRSLGTKIVAVLTVAGMLTVTRPVLAGSPFGIKDLDKVVSAVQEQGSGGKGSSGNKSSGNDWSDVANKIINDFTPPGGGDHDWHPKPHPKPCPTPLPVPFPHPQPCPKPYPQPCPKPFPVPYPTPYPVPCPAPIVCPLPGNTLPPPVCTNPLPGDCLPGTPATGRGLTIVNPETTSGTVRFRLGEQQYELESGYRQEVQSGGSQVIEFDRGGNFGKARYTLREGTYHFSVSDRGWDIIKKSFRVAIDNSQGQSDFRYSIGGQLQTVRAGVTNQHKDSFPLVVEFDQGRGGEPAQRLLEDGTYRIGIDPDTGLWDMFAAQADTSIAGNSLSTGNPLPTTTPVVENAANALPFASLSSAKPLN